MLLSGYNFLFYYENVIKAGFQKISGIGGKIEVEYIHEGGRLDCAYPIRGTKKSAGRLAFEKGCGFLNPLRSPAGFVPGKRIGKTCSIIIPGTGGTVKKAFAFDGGLIVSWECTPLDAKSGELIIDKVEIEHTGIYEIC
ncbi:MAG: phage tail protein [Oscillospiraceae bacterium]|jgi:hypothetical protein|nr:phage tail protein [Oscillospiraceae bacterium]